MLLKPEHTVDEIKEILRQRFESGELPMQSGDSVGVADWLKAAHQLTEETRR